MAYDRSSLGELNWTGTFYQNHWANREHYQRHYQERYLTQNQNMQPLLWDGSPVEPHTTHPNNGSEGSAWNSMGGAFYGMINAYMLRYRCINRCFFPPHGCRLEELRASSKQPIHGQITALPVEQSYVGVRRTTSSPCCAKIEMPTVFG